MKLSRIAAVLVAFAIVPATTSADEITTLSVRSAHSIVLPAPGLSRVAVGDGRIAGVVPIGRTEVIVNGKSPGQTTLFVWRGARRYTYEINVTEQSVDDVAAMLRSAISNPDVHVVSFDRSVVLRGAVPGVEQMAQLDDLLARFAPDAKANNYSLINAVTVTRPLGTLQADLSGVAGANGVQVDRDAKGDLVVSGRVPDRVVAERVLDRVRAVGGMYLGGDSKVVDRLDVDTLSQVDVKVYILEVDRTALDQLGVRLQSGTPDPAHPGFYILGDPNFPVQESVAQNSSNKVGSGPGFPGRALNIGAFYRTVILAPTLDLIMRSGHARLLSAPDLVTMPGREATFLVGGEIPIPYAFGPQQIAITYKEFGVRLQMTPTILGTGAVETRIAPEVSDLDFADGIQASGFVIPALKTSKLSTDVVTHSGESIVMGGLLRRQETRNLDKIPLLGDLPILGKLFRSTRYQNAETDVVFVMTPQILTR